MNTPGEELRKLRKDRNWTQAALAQRAGVVQMTISKFENDKGNQKKETLRKIAAAFGMTLPEFHTRLVEPRPEVRGPRPLVQETREVELIGLFRLCTDAEQIRILEFARFTRREQRADGTGPGFTHAK